MRVSKSILLGGVLLMGTGGLMAQTTGNPYNWREQWFKVKTGRNTPMEEARQKAEAANIAFREESVPPAVTPVLHPYEQWREQWFKVKTGRNTPMEEARQKAEAANTAFREESVPPAVTLVLSPYEQWREQWSRLKFGRSFE